MAFQPVSVNQQEGFKPMKNIRWRWIRFQIWLTHTCCQCEKRMWFDQQDFCSVECTDRWFADVSKALKDAAEKYSTPEKALAWLVQLGTHNPDGTLTENYTTSETRG